MASVVRMLKQHGKLNGVKPYICETDYEVLTGSVSYGLETDTSDMGIVGITTPPLEIIFPHLKGDIRGFGTDPENFETAQVHHIQHNTKEYDVCVYNVVKFFDLAKDNNPNILDALFVTDRCVLTCSNVGKIIRENRKEFLHKGSYHKFRGYAYTQLRKLKTKKSIGKRLELVKKYGYDTKYAYHLIRLLDECDQILTHHDIDLERNRQEHKSIREGEFTLEKLEEMFDYRHKMLETKLERSTLPEAPDEAKLKKLLVSCIEEKHGSISGFYNLLGNDDKKMINKYRRILEIVNE